MSENALPKGYEPHAVEDHWREYWEKNKTFTPDPDAPGEPFSIVIPPPNVTGALHIGHALNHTLIDGPAVNDARVPPRASVPLFAQKDTSTGLRSRSPGKNTATTRGKRPP